IAAGVRTKTAYAPGRNLAAGGERSRVVLCGRIISSGGRTPDQKPQAHPEDALTRSNEGVPHPNAARGCACPSSGDHRRRTSRGIRLAMKTTRLSIIAAHYRRARVQSNGEDFDHGSLECKEH